MANAEWWKNGKMVVISTPRRAGKLEEEAFKREWDEPVFKREYMGEFVHALHCSECKRFASKHEINKMSANGGSLPDEWCCNDCYRRLLPGAPEKEWNGHDWAPVKKLAPTFSVSGPVGMELSESDGAQGRRVVICGRRQGKTEAMRQARAAWESVHGPDPARICADCGGEMVMAHDELNGTAVGCPTCQACRDEHDAARRVADEESPTEPAPPPEPNCGVYGEPFDSYRRCVNPKVIFGFPTCSNCDERMQLANSEMPEPASWIRGQRVYDEPPRAPISAEARWHNANTSQADCAKPGWEE